jgi:hypothetical protein
MEVILERWETVNMKCKGVYLGGLKTGKPISIGYNRNSDLILY